jgi:hypothetical protein
MDSRVFYFQSCVPTKLKLEIVSQPVEPRSMMENATDQEPQAEEAQVLRLILRAIREIRYGSVQIVIQDSKVVQIDKVEKLRLV